MLNSMELISPTLQKSILSLSYELNHTQILTSICEISSLKPDELPLVINIVQTKKYNILIFFSNS